MITWYTCFLLLLRGFHGWVAVVWHTRLPLLKEGQLCPLVAQRLYTHIYNHAVRTTISCQREGWFGDFCLWLQSCFRYTRIYNHSVVTEKVVQSLLGEKIEIEKNLRPIKMYVQCSRLFMCSAPDCQHYYLVILWEFISGSACWTTWIKLRIRDLSGPSPLVKI